MTADIAALVQRLEAAMGASRDLDWEITKAIATKVETRDGEAHQIAHTPLRFAVFTKHDCPAFSASLDAALSLLGPPGYPLWTLKLDIRGDTKDRSYCFAEVTVPSSEFQGRSREPAIAVAIAALKARARAAGTREG